VGRSPIFSGGSDYAPGAPLSPEAERILAAMPGVIADEHAGEVLVPSGEPSSAGDLADMLPDIDFDPLEVGAVLEEMFDWIAERRNSACWKLTERQSRMLAKPTAQLCATLYAKLAQFLPGWLANLCDQTPGLMGVIVAGSIVVAPKVVFDFRTSRARRKAPRPVTVGSSQGVRPSPGPVGPVIVNRPAGPSVGSMGGVGAVESAPATFGVDQGY